MVGMDVELQMQQEAHQAVPTADVATFRLAAVRGRISYQVQRTAIQPVKDGRSVPSTAWSVSAEIISPAPPLSWRLPSRFSQRFSPNISKVRPWYKRAACSGCLLAALLVRLAACATRVLLKAQSALPSHHRPKV